MILNQTRTGKACPRHVAHLRSEIPKGSLMCFVTVHAWDLAMVLDRLEALEDFQAETLRWGRHLAAHKSVD